MVKISFHCNASKHIFIKRNNFSASEIIEDLSGAIVIAEDTHNFIESSFVYAVTAYE